MSGMKLSLEVMLSLEKKRRKVFSPSVEMFVSFLLFLFPST